MDETLPTLKLPVQPPIEPMLAQLTRDMPSGGGWLYEPKWDGFCALVFWDGGTLVIQSRDLKPLGPVSCIAFELLVDGSFEGAGMDGGRFRHGTTFQHRRPDKPAAQCTFDQLTFAVPVEIDEIFGLSASRQART